MTMLEKTLSGSNHWWVAAVLALLGCVALYGHALNGAFFLDDSTSIRIEPLMLQDQIWPLFEKFRLRAVGYVSFWLNYQFSGESTSSFRAVNFLIHTVNGFLVYVLALRFLQSTSDQNHIPIKLVALSASLLFLANPLQTQAITYIVQRLASLAALFYLLSLVAWFEASTPAEKNYRWMWWGLFALSVVLALLTKQNTFTLPAAIILIEWLVRGRISTRHIGGLLIVAVVVAVGMKLLAPDLFGAIDQFTRETQDLSRWQYFKEQWVILWIYLAKMFYPYPQLLDYGLAVGSFSNWQLAIGALGHIALLSIALYLRARQPVISFGILFFYLAHTVESGFIPITDLIFEHRNYLPSVGVFIALSGLVLWINSVWSDRRVSGYLIAAVMGLLLSSAYATWQRNAVWADQKQLLIQDVAINPSNVRALHNLALWYQRNGEYDYAMETMKRLLVANGGQLDLVHATTYAATLIDLKLYDQAMRLLDKLIEIPMRPKARAAFLRLLATATTGKGDDLVAVDLFEEALVDGPLDYDSGLAYGYSLIQVGRFTDAERLIEQMGVRFGERTKLTLLSEVLADARKRSAPSTID